MPPDDLHDALDVLEYLIVPEPQYRESLLPQALITNPVAFSIGSMLPAVQLDDDTRFKAHKIDNVTADRLLSSEFDALNLFGSQTVP